MNSIKTRNACPLWPRKARRRKYVGIRSYVHFNLTFFTTLPRFIERHVAESCNFYYISYTHVLYVCLSMYSINVSEPAFLMSRSTHVRQLCLINGAETFGSDRRSRKTGRIGSGIVKSAIYSM